MRNKGITLIALVITIVVLLIITGVSIVTLTGENGILIQAQQSKKMTKMKSDMEIIRMAYSTSETSMKLKEYLKTNEYGSYLEGIFLEELKKTDNNATFEYKYVHSGYYGSWPIKDVYYFIYYNGDNYIFNSYTNKFAQEEQEKQEGQLTEEQLEERAIKMKVVPFEDGIVVLPISVEYNCTVDWGDGNITTNEGRIPDYFRYGAPEGINHQYTEENQEYIVTIKSESITSISNCIYPIDVSNDRYYHSSRSLLEIIKWGETGLKGIGLNGNELLTNIASPEENSFKDLEVCCFKYCVALTKIPEDFFDNTPKIEDLRYAFAECTSLTGNAPKIWLRGNIRGTSCFYDSTGLANYEEIDYDWKKISY